jgi:chromosome partitioning protein
VEGRRTLVVDMDPQGHATLGLLSDASQVRKTMYDVFVHHRNGRDTRLRDIIRSVHVSLDLAPADILLSAVPELFATTPEREDMLAEILSDVRHHYDYILVDCPPHVGLLTFNALRACSEAIVPVDASFYSLHGVGKLLETFDVLARKTGHELVVRAVVTLYCGRTQFARDVVEEIRRHLTGRHFKTLIRHSVKLAEAASHGIPIAGYCSRCAGFEDYEALTAEVLEMETRRPATDSSGLSAPTVTPEGVVFSVEAPSARQVQLAGDFNGWTVDGNEMTPHASVWTKVIKLDPGRYRYRYVVDGMWQSDPLNAEVEPSPYGGHDSVFVMNDGLAK